MRTYTRVIVCMIGLMFVLVSMVSAYDNNSEQVTQPRNNPPDNPSTPTGPTSGVRNTEYSYNTSTTEPDGDNIYYFWYWGDGTGNTWYGPYSSGETCTQSHQWTDLGTYDVKVKAKDQQNLESLWSTPLTVTIENILPWVRMNGPYNAEVGEEILFDGSDSIDPDGNVILYEWSYSIGWGLPVVMGTGVTIYYSFDEADEYVIYLTLTDNDGGTNYTTSTATIIDAGPVVNAGGPYNGEVGIPITFSGTASEGTPPYTFNWDFGDGGTSAEQNPTYTYSNPGNYDIILTVLDSQGNTGSDFTSALIEIPPLTADANGPYYGTMDEPLQFNGTATGGIPPYTFHWHFGDNHISNIQNPTHQYTSEGVYNVTFTVINMMYTVRATTTAFISDEPNQPPLKPQKPKGPTDGEIGISYTYESYVTDPDHDSMEVMFDWGDGTNTSWIGPIDSYSLVEENHTYTTHGTYSIRVIARDIPYREESEWSDHLEISIPKHKVIINPILRFLMNFFQNVLESFNIV